MLSLPVSGAPHLATTSLDRRDTSDPSLFLHAPARRPATPRRLQQAAHSAKTEIFLPRFGKVLSRNNNGDHHHHHAEAEQCAF